MVPQQYDAKKGDSIHEINNLKVHIFQKFCSDILTILKVWGKPTYFPVHLELFRQFASEVHDWSDMYIFFQESISEASVRKFCKEAANLVLHKDSGSIADELSGNLSPKSKLYETIEQNPDSEATYYLILRAVDRFQTDFNVIPGM